MDGSPHAWLGERAEKFVLSYATGTAAQAVFHPTEDTRLVLLEGLVPLALYMRPASAFKHNARQIRVARVMPYQQIFA